MAFHVGCILVSMALHSVVSNADNAGPRPLPTNCSGGVMRLGSHLYFQSENTFIQNCTIMGEQGSVIVGQVNFGLVQLNGSIRFDGIGKQLLILQLIIQNGNVEFTNCSDLTVSSYLSLVNTRANFTGCSISTQMGVVVQMQNASVVLSNAGIGTGQILIDNSSVQIEKGWLQTYHSPIQFTNVSLSMMSSWIFVERNLVTFENSVLLAYRSGISVDASNVNWTPIKFVNCIANFTGPIYEQPTGVNASISVYGDAQSSSGVAFVDSAVTFSNCSSLDQAIHRDNPGEIDVQGGRLRCTKQVARSRGGRAKSVVVV